MPPHGAGGCCPSRHWAPPLLPRLTTGSSPARPLAAALGALALLLAAGAQWNVVCCDERATAAPAAAGAAVAAAVPEAGRRGRRPGIVPCADAGTEGLSTCAVRHGARLVLCLGSPDGSAAAQRRLRRSSNAPASRRQRRRLERVRDCRRRPPPPPLLRNYRVASQAIGTGVESIGTSALAGDDAAAAASAAAAGKTRTCALRSRSAPVAAALGRPFKTTMDTGNARETHGADAAQRDNGNATVGHAAAAPVPLARLRWPAAVGIVGNGAGARVRGECRRRAANHPRWRGAAGCWRLSRCCETGMRAWRRCAELRHW